jgi:hypothetical protein
MTAKKKAPGTDPGAALHFIFFAISDSTVNGTRITANNIIISGAPHQENRLPNQQY